MTQIIRLLSFTKSRPKETRLICGGITCCPVSSPHHDRVIAVMAHHTVPLFSLSLFHPPGHRGWRKVEYD